MKLFSGRIVAIIALLTMLSTSYASDSKEIKYRIKMNPLNHSGVEAKIKIKLKGENTLQIEIKATGFEPNRPHAQHIHGLSNRDLEATCPTLSADTNADGIISVGEGLPFYGPIVLPLVPFDLVGSDGKLKYKASYTVNLNTLMPIEKRTIVLHGMTVNGVYVPSLPVACGQIEIKD